MDPKEQLEKELAEALTEGDMDREDPGEAAIRQLSNRYEVRVVAETEPVVEETNLYRNMAEEVDDRYDRFVNRKRSDESQSDGRGK